MRLIRGTFLRSKAALGVLFLCLLVSLVGSVARAQGDTPVDFTIAFIGDQGLGPNSQAVLNLIKDEQADAVVHSGDFDYVDDPSAWDAQIDGILGPNFPYFASAGNHDLVAWTGYQAVLEARMNRIGVSWQGDLGVQSSFKYAGIFIVLTAPDLFGDPGDGYHDLYIANELAVDDSIWRISSWHKNMRAMQLGGKTDDTGWGVYEESRRGGAIIATGHEHSYSRTHLLSSCQSQTVASTSNTLVLSQDDPGTAVDEGRSFVFVSGLGGRNIRGQERDGAWWAARYTSDQGANYGALFGVFNYRGDPNLAYFYFMDIDRNIPDQFFVQSVPGSGPPPPPPPVPGEQLVSGTRLIIKNKLPDDESGNRIVFVSKDPTISIASPGSDGDPRCGAGGGGSIEFYSSASGESLTAPLPCQNWKLLGSETSPKGYLYLDRELDDGPCRVVLMKSRPLRGVARGKCSGGGPATLGYDLREAQPQDPVSVRITMGTSASYCTEFSRDVRRDGSDGRIFLAGESPAPGSCPFP